MAYTDYYNDINTGKLKNIYGFYGSERFIMNSMIEISKKKFIETGLEAIDFVDYDAKGLSYAEAKKIVEHLPFASEKRLVVFRNPDFIDSEKWDREKLDAFLELHSEATHVLTLLIFDKLDKRKYGTKALDKVGKIVEFSHIDRNSLITWVQSKFALFGCKATRSAIEYIADNSGYLEKNNEGDLAKLFSLIQVIASSVSGDIVGLDDVKLHLEARFDSNVFKWRKAILSGKAKESIYYLHALFEEDEPAIKLLSMLQKQVRDLYEYSLLKMSGISEAQIAKKMGKQTFMLKELNMLMNSNLYKNFDEAIKLLLDTDDMMKIGGIDGEVALQNLAFKIEKIGIGV